MHTRISALLLLAMVVPAPAAERRSSEQILSLMKKVCDWQLALLPTENTSHQDPPIGWIRAPFYDGTMALYKASGDARYLGAMMKIGQENRWDLARRKGPTSGPAAGKPFIRHADDLAVGQLYAELYLIKKDPAMITPLKQRLDQIMTQPIPGREEWWWCDALFMAPPGFARLSATTADKKYLDYMDKQWWDATDFLYDKSEHLFYRDKSYFTKKEANGKKIFWSRGNAWVLAGIARVLQYLPADYPTRPRYIRLMNEMSRKIASLQQPDGFWRASLLDPDSYKGGETSGTAFYCYAMTWGINNNILSRENFRPVVEKAWTALLTAVDPDTAAVGWVQPTGAAPAAVKKDDIAEYGTGAFLLAASEILKLK